MPRQTYEKNRPTIGLFINQIEGRGISPIWNGVADVAEEYDYNLVIFTGKSLASPFDDEDRFNIIYDTAGVDKLKGLIVSSGALASYVGRNNLADFLQPFRTIPVVSISLLLDGIPSVVTDNMSGMRQTVEHLIKKHNHRRIAFVRGPDTNPEAQERFQAYQDTLKENGIAVDEDLIVNGDFRFGSGADAVRVLMDERKVRFTAIAAANDDMALGIYDELQKRSIQVPKEIAVTGFDDIDDVRYLNVPITTVHQPLYEQGRKAAEMIIAMIDGRDVPMKVGVQTNLVVRSSCGCMSLSLPDILAKAAEKQYPEDTSKAIEKLILEKRKDIILDALDIMVIPDEDKKKYLIMLDTLLDAIVTDIKQEYRSGLFLETLNLMLSNNSIDESVLPYWQKVVFSISCTVVKHMKTLDALYSAELMFQSAQILVSNILYRRQVFVTQQAFGLIWNIRGAILRINSCFNLDELMDIVACELPPIGLKGGYIAFYEKEPSGSPAGVNGKAPAFSKLALAFHEGKRLNLEMENPPYPTRNLLPDWLPINQIRHTLIVQPLFNKKDQFGFFVFELGPREELFYEIIRKPVSSAIKGSFLFNERQETEKKLKAALTELETTNRELHNLSLKDELTGLYNRRGLAILGEQHFQLTRHKKGKFILFFVDIDGLKFINDNFGHREGDEAIRESAKILRSTFRQGDIIARFGGDEFVILVTEPRKPDEDIKQLQKRLDEKLEDYNLEAGKPYRLSLTLGASALNPGSTSSFEELMSEADKKLYEKKKKPLVVKLGTKKTGKKKKTAKKKSRK